MRTRMRTNPAAVKSSPSRFVRRGEGLDWLSRDQISAETRSSLPRNRSTARWPLRGHMRSLLILGCGLALAGCAQDPVVVRPVAVTKPATAGPPRSLGAFEGGKFAAGKGRNTIKGHAEIGGENGVRTCAGAMATLVPAISATRARMDSLYGAGNDIVRIDAGGLPARSPELERLAKHVRCDSNGNFRFEQVADGDFFVTAGFTGKPVASVKREVSVHDGDAVSVQLVE